MRRDLLLLFVAYHPSERDISKLMKCLSQLFNNIGYAVVVNDYIEHEPVEKLFVNADYVLCNKKNLGYGAAINMLINSIPYEPEFIGALNTDLIWERGTFEGMITWLRPRLDINLIAPEILDVDGKVQKLCKMNPTVLAMLSRRFIPEGMKPAWLQKYDNWYIMNHQNYSHIFESEYLSGCCMVFRTSAFIDIGGFDERYFLYLEDADITRMLSKKGLCVYYPDASVTHLWGRGNYKRLSLMWVNIISAWKYFCKWGWKLW